MIPESAHATFTRVVESARSFALVTHVNPDGDAIGSEVGLAAYLLARGKDVRIINHDPTPEILRFVELDEPAVECYEPARHDAVLLGVDRVVLVDNSVPDRLGAMEAVMQRAAGRTLCIDHHPSRDAAWADLILDVGSCATAAMIWELTTRTGYRPDPKAAWALYVGLATDTGFFRFNSTSPVAHEIAAALLRLGVEPARAYERLHERNPLAYVRLMGHALAGLRTDAGGAVASVEIPRRLVEQLQAHDVDATEITTALLAMEGVRIAILFRELADGRIKVSLRSKGALDVHRLAGEFGGGGHRNASGIVIEGSLGDVVELVSGRAAALASRGAP